MQFEARAIFTYHNWRYPQDKRDLHIKTHGYKRSDEEIVEVASNNGLSLLAVEMFDFQTELERSFCLYPRLKDMPLASWFITQAGKKMPFVRMFSFEKCKC